MFMTILESMGNLPGSYHGSLICFHTDFQNLRSQSISQARVLQGSKDKLPQIPKRLKPGLFAMARRTSVCFFFLKYRGTPNHPKLDHFSIESHAFWGTPTFSETFDPFWSSDLTVTNPGLVLTSKQSHMLRYVSQMRTMVLEY